jgi:hypothetical protein
MCRSECRSPQSGHLGRRFRSRRTDPRWTTSRSPSRDCCSPAEGGVCGCNVPLAAWLDRERERSSRAARLATEGPTRSRHSCSRASPTSSAVKGILRSCGAGSQREMTCRTHPTTRRPSPSPSWSSGDDSAHRRPDAHARDRDCRGRDLPPPCPACEPLRWAIRWAKPSRIGPYQAQPGASVGMALWLDLQAFLGLKRQRTPCFTRERTLVRNQPRPS